MMKRGQPDKAIDKLNKEFDKYKPSSQDPQPLTAYNLRMALVEILICQVFTSKTFPCSTSLIDASNYLRYLFSLNS